MKKILLLIPLLLLVVIVGFLTVPLMNKDALAPLKIGRASRFQSL